MKTIPTETIEGWVDDFDENGGGGDLPEDVVAAARELLRYRKMLADIAAMLEAEPDRTIAIGLTTPTDTLPRDVCVIWTGDPAYGLRAPTASRASGPQVTLERAIPLIIGSLAGPLDPEWVEMARRNSEALRAMEAERVAKVGP